MMRRQGRDFAVLLRRQSGEIPKFSCEVGLIAITCVDRRLNPGRARIRREALQDVLKSQDSRIRLGRKSHCVAEQADKMTMAIAAGLYDFADIGGR